MNTVLIPLPLAQLRVRVGRNKWDGFTAPVGSLKPNGYGLFVIWRVAFGNGVRTNMTATKTAGCCMGLLGATILLITCAWLTTVALNLPPPHRY
ncbi:TPA: hypothetical protein EYN65_24575 [Candidatus Poribacteria bacterium]|nr:hypothetical protein [Candidatus Poribacteria bacterium]